MASRLSYRYLEKFTSSTLEFIHLTSLLIYAGVFRPPKHGCMVPATDLYFLHEKFSISSAAFHGRTDFPAPNLTYYLTPSATASLNIHIFDKLAAIPAFVYPSLRVLQPFSKRNKPDQGFNFLL